VHFGDGKAEAEEKHTTALRIFSVGVGALTMVGGKAIGVRGLIKGVVHVSELFTDETVRRYAAPVIGAVIVGAMAYSILKLPNLNYDTQDDWSLHLSIAG
jgi:mitofusin